MTGSVPVADRLVRGSYRIGRWQVDGSARRARDGTVERKFSPRAAAVLDLLVEARGEVVSRARILDRVWADVHVTDESVTQAVAELRRALGGGSSIIETVPKAGYRLTVPVVREGGLRPPGDPVAFDLAAYRLCLEARTVMARSGPDAVEISEALSREAAERAPGFALARAEYAIALVYRRLYRDYGGPGLAEAADHAEAATRLKPDLALGHAAYGYALGAMGLWDRAQGAFGRALAADPRDPEAHYLFARTMFAAQDYAGAVTIGERAAALDGDDYRSLYLAARAGFVVDPRRGRELAGLCLQRLRAHLERDPDEPRALNALGPILALLGRHGEAHAAMEADRSRGTVLEFYNVVGAAAIGDAAGAAEAMEAVVDRGWRHPDWLISEPVLQGLMGQGRFRRVARALKVQ
ncbi:MAG: winged helix-turn-helix domain-containing protein [Pseudomonadota bacterium]